MSNIPKRNEIPVEDTWKLEDLFESDESYKSCFDKTKALIPKLKAFAGKLTLSANTLFEFLKLQDDASSQLGLLYLYAHMRLHQDGANAFYQNLSTLSENLSVDFGEALAFVEPELSALTPEKLNDFYKKLPALKLYARYFNELLRQKAHILDAQTEGLLARFSEIGSIPQNTFAMLNNVDLEFPTLKNEKGETVKLTHATYIPLLESHDRSVRKAAFDGLYSVYSHYCNTISSLFAGNVKQYDLFSSLRHYESPLQHALSANNIPIEVYTKLIEVVHHHLGLMHRYVDLRKKSLGLSEIHMYDLFVPMIPDFEKTIPYEEACQIILEALKPLGEDYLTHVKEALNNRWIDKYENEGKRSGAYSWSTYGAAHPYILLNYTPNVNGLFTLIHEMGHAMHSYYSEHTQPGIYADYCIFVAEVASTVNEALLMQYLLKTTTDENYKKYLINYFMEQFKSTLYRQTMFAEFEYKMHTLNTQGVPLTAKLLNSTYYELVKTYHGETMQVDEAIAYEWARIPHFYTPFYVYQYATGYSAAITLSKRILEGPSHAAEDYLNFLKGGCSKDPIDLLKDAGVDMTSSQPVEDALNEFKTLLDTFSSF